MPLGNIGNVSAAASPHDAFEPVSTLGNDRAADRSGTAIASLWEERL